MLKLYAHPLSSYCWKAMIALDEKGADYEILELGADHPEHGAAFAALWPIAKMPLLVDGERAVAESSVIAEYVDRRWGAPGVLVPEGEAALRVRFLDRVFDNYVMTPMSRIVAERFWPEDRRSAGQVEDARALLERAYGWLEGELGEGWAAAADFTLADCAAFPSLFYADQVPPMGGRYPRLEAYLGRLRERPSCAKARAGAQPYWHMFPYANG